MINDFVNKAKELQSQYGFSDHCALDISCELEKAFKLSSKTKGFIEPIEEKALQEESIKAATHYLRKTGSDTATLDQQQLITNSIAHGFFMGVRWKEQNGK